MSLLAGTCYDPATAVSKSLASPNALTALDTTNLRLTFTVPSSGRVQVRIAGCTSGNAGTADFFFGVLEGATVRGRAAPQGGVRGTNATTTHVTCESVFLVTGLTSGASLTWDAAYSVDTATATTGAIIYGGPDDTTANNAWGGFCFEVWTVG